MAKNDAMEVLRQRRHETGVAFGRGWNHTKGWWWRTEGRLVVARNHVKGWWLRTKGHVANAPKAAWDRISRFFRWLARQIRTLARMVRSIPGKVRRLVRG
jgi:hypothetical protein